MKHGNELIKKLKQQQQQKKKYIRTEHCKMYECHKCKAKNSAPKLPQLKSYIIAPKVCVCVCTLGCVCLHIQTERREGVKICIKVVN